MAESHRITNRISGPNYDSSDQDKEKLFKKEKSAVEGEVSQSLPRPENVGKVVPVTLYFDEERTIIGTATVDSAGTVHAELNEDIGIISDHAKYMVQGYSFEPVSNPSQLSPESISLFWDEEYDS